MSHKAKILIVVIVVLNINFAWYEKSKRNNYSPSVSTKTSPGSGTIKNSPELEDEIKELYSCLQASTLKPSFEVFKKGVKGFFKLKSQNLLQKNLLTLVDYSLPSTKERLWIIDMDCNKVLISTLVAHGKNSGLKTAEKFSNKPQSFMSSVGLFLTGDTYFGKHGLSLFLKGLEKGINDNAFNRSIVMHGASYVSQAFIKANGYLGRSLGCPSIPEELKEEIIPVIAKGSCLYIYYPEKK